jgi:23S rRNA (guanosine2251-2'-O)-methyltransferase
MNTRVSARLPAKRRASPPPDGTGRLLGETKRHAAPVPAERWIYGRHTVAAALANPHRRWHQLVSLASLDSEAQTLAAGAFAQYRGASEKVRILNRAEIDALLPTGAVHQGLALRVDPLPEPALDDLLRGLPMDSGRQVVVALDRVTDPHNVGAVLRSAAAFGAAAVVVVRHGAPPISGALAKVASGALESVPLVRVVNLARTLDCLKRAGFWICGLDVGAARPLAAVDLGERVVLVLGSEGGGLRALVRRCCDHLARLPTGSRQPTLNLSSAAAAALYELARGGNKLAAC